MNWLARFYVWLTGHSRQPTFPHIFWLLNCAWLNQAVYVVVKLDIAEKLRNGPLSIADLAAQCAVKETPLLQVMRALAGYGIFSQDRGGRFALNAGARPLLRDDQYSAYDYARLWGEQLYPAGGRMLEQVQTGTSGFELQWGQRVWEFYRDHTPEANIFDTFMSAATDLHERFIIYAQKFSGYQRVVDVGGGRGSLISAVLKANPHLRGIWYDRPEVLPGARARLETENLVERCDLVAGNFLESVPTGGDVYLIKHVLHDWTDDEATQILTNIARAMSASATLIIIEAVMDGRNGRDGLCKLRDLEQMFTTGGRVRTRDDFARILAPAGLAIVEITRTAIVDVCLIEIRKVQASTIASHG